MKVQEQSATYLAQTISGGWCEKPLHKLVTKLVDGSHNPPPKQDTGVPMLSARNIENNSIVFDVYRLIAESAFKTEHARTRITAGDVLLTIVGTIGRAAVVSESATPFALQRSVAVLTPGPELLPKFLVYQLQSPAIQRYFEAKARGTAQKGVYLKTLGQTPIQVAPLDQQKRIVAEIEKQFSHLDEAIAILKRVKANLKRYKAAVLKAAVEGRLVETEAELARREGRSYETGAQLLQHILETRRSQWQGKSKYKEPVAPDTADLLELPEGWVWASIDQLTGDSLIGLDRGRDQQNTEGIGAPYVKMNNITMEGEVTSEGMVYVDASNEEKNRFNLQIGDLLFNTRNSKELVGKVGIVRSHPSGAIYNNNLMRLRAVNGVLPSFVCSQMCSDGFRRQMELVKKATTNVAAVYAKDLFPLPLALPPLAEQHRIDAEVERHLSLADGAAAQVAANLKHSEILRQSVLHRAFCIGT